MDVFIIVSIISMMYNLIYGRSHNLSCGIFGFSGKAGKKVDPYKLLVLGLYNRTRGVDSTGYYYNGNIVKGIDKMADFKDFIVENRFTPGNLPFETVMAHTRKATHGSNTAENAHPHVIENYVQTHNGTIKNIWELCRKNDIDSQKIYVDSIGLAAIIQKNGFDVLNNYIGYAALTMVFMDDPESLYLYHGASREKKDETVWEERPLFTLKTKEGLYYSSIKESLTMITDSKTNLPETLPHNRVYVIKGGVIVKDVYNVERDNANVTYTPPVVVYGAWRGGSDAPAIVRELPFVVSSDNKSDRTLLFKESKPLEYSTQDVYYRFGRHFATVAQPAGKNAFDYKEVLLDGLYRINREGKILTADETSESHYDMLYFIHGVMIRDEKSYKAAHKELKDQLASNSSNIAWWLSEYSKYPLTCFITEGSGVGEDLKVAWYENRKRFDGTINARFSKRTYRIKKGRLTNIRPAWEQEELFSCVDIQMSSLGIDKPENKLSITTSGVTIKQENMVKLLSHVNDVVELTPEQLADAEEWRELFAVIVDMIDEWSDKIIKPEEITEIPEQLLIFMEYAENTLANYKLEDKEKFDAVTRLISDLVGTKQTYKEYLTGELRPNFINADNLDDCFSDYTSDCLYNLENRYTVVSFESEIDKLDDPTFEEADVIEFMPNEDFDNVGIYENDICSSPQPKEPEDAFGHTVSGDTAIQSRITKLESRVNEFIELASEYRSKNTALGDSKAWEIETNIKSLKAEIKVLTLKY